MILIGSRALAHYGLNRKCIDWDFIGSQTELKKFKSMADHFIDKPYSTILKIDGDIVEFTLHKPSDDLIYTVGSMRMTFRGFHYEIPDLEGLLAIKEATADFLNREKHFQDINWIYEKDPKIKRDEELYHAKRSEIAERISQVTQNKYQFFHKYHNVEKIEHDKLHDMIAGMLFHDGYATWKLFVSGDVEVSEEAWNILPEDMKLRRFVEETLVLTLERWYIPKLMKHGVHNPKIKNNFVHMSSVLCEHVLRGLKDEDPFMSQWGRDNRERVIKAVDAYAKMLVLKKFPTWFYDELYQMRFK